MDWGSSLHLLAALFIASSPTELLADDCSSPSVTGVRLSASSYRNVTGHWVTRAAITRRTTRDVSDLQYDERPLRYYVDISRQSCGDDETLTTTFSVIVPPVRVGSDYKFFPNVGYYKLHTDNTNWTNAQKICAKEGAHLAIVNSEAEENAIREVMRSHSTEKFAALIGFHDRVKEGEHITVFGDPLSSTGRVRWADGEPSDTVFPDSPDGEDCGNIYSDGTINDIRCSRELPFVCEQSI